MSLFSQSQIDEINAVAAKSQEVLKPVKVSKSLSSFQSEIQKSSAAVLDYFKDSPAILITTKQQLHDYVLKAIESGYCGIDTETTGLDRIQDSIVGASLYYPGGVECYIPCKHLVPVFDTLYKDQLTYEDVGEELQLFVEAKTKMIFANADFDLAFIYKDFNVDMIDICYYDVILAWRCLKEDEKNNALKPLYTKYVLRGKADPKKFSDFFSPKTFPYSKPDVAKLYAANDAKITYELFVWQLPYVTKSHPKCQKNHLEKIADLVWNIEIPMIRVCALMHRHGIFLDLDTSHSLQSRYHRLLEEESAKLADMVQEIIDNADTLTKTKSPFKTGKEFNQSSSLQVKYLLNAFMGLQVDSSNKNILKELNLPITKQILKVRSITTLLGSFVDKLPGTTGKDGRVHSTFKSIGADTGRMCIAKGENIICSTSSTGIKHIEDIVPGDVVYCFNSDGELEEKPVKNLWLTGRDKECVGINWVDADDSTNAGLLICTPEHLILTISGEWISAQQLNPGDELVHWVSHIHPKVTSIVSVGTYDVYDIEVEDNHNFIAEGICVHNSSENPNVQNIPSHALDVRHQFRATPAMEKVDKCDVSDNNISINLFNYDTVDLEDRSDVKVKDLKVGDKVKLIKDKLAILAEIVSLTNDAPYTLITMQEVM